MKRPPLLFILTLTLAGCRGLEVDLVASGTSHPALVNLFLRITDASGDPVAELEESHFSLLEDGTELSDFESQFTIRSPEQTFQIDSLLLLDMSGSVVGSGNLPELLDAAEEFALSVVEDGSVAVAVFDGRDEPDLIIDFGDDAGALSEAIRGLESWQLVDSSTNLYGAVTGGLGALDARQTEHPLYAGTLTVFTDGTHRAGEGGTYPSYDDVVSAVKATDHGVFAIGLGAEIYQGVLETIGANGFAWAEDTSALASAFQDIADHVRELARSFYAVSYCSPARTGQHSLELLVDCPAGRGQIVHDFDAQGFEGGCSTGLDTGIE